jgi:hypothetical protein
MFTGTLSPVSNKADWIEAYGVYDDETGDPVDVSAASEIAIAIRDPASRSVLLSATLSGGSIEHIETGVFQWTFTAAQMQGLCAKTYEVGLTILQDDQTIQLFVGTLPVIDGIVS